MNIDANAPSTKRCPSSSQLEGGRLLSATNAAYIRTCLMPNANAVVAANMEGLATLPDHQKPGFLL